VVTDIDQIRLQEDQATMKFLVALEHLNNNTYGHKGYIDYGIGEDSLWRNTSIEHDVASNCEYIHAR
jgi:hypothetical protein